MLLNNKSSYTPVFIRKIESYINNSNEMIVSIALVNQYGYILPLI